MKVPVPWISLGLTAGSAFAAAFFIARRDPPAAAEPSKTVAAIAEAAAAREAKVTAAAAAEKSITAATGSAGVLNDLRLREALAMPDLAAAIRHIMAHEVEDHCADTRLICLVEQLPAARLSELPAALAAHIGNEFIVRFVMSAWAERDAAGALAWIRSTPAPDTAGTSAFLTGWMRAAPEAALAWLDAQPLSTASGQMRSAAVEAMAEKDPAAALTMMQERGWTSLHPDAILRLLSNWGGRDPAAALEALRTLHAGMGLNLESEPPGLRRFSSTNAAFRTMLQALLFGAFQRNPEEAAAVLARLSPEELTAGHDAISSEVFARDPSASEALFTPRPDERTRQLLQSMATHNPSAVLGKLGRLEDPSLRQDLLRAMGKGDFNSEQVLFIPPEARETVRETLAAMTDPHEKADTAQNLCRLTAKSDPAWAAELWQGLPAKDQVASAHRFITGAGVAHPQEVLAAWSASPQDVQSQSLKSLCFALGSSAPDAALTLVLQDRDPARRVECAATLFAVWSAKDAASAFAAMEEHAAALDPAAILDALPRAGRFSLHSRSESGSSLFSTSERVDPAKLENHLRQLNGTGPSNP